MERAVPVQMTTPPLVIRLSPQAFAYLEALGNRNGNGPVKQAELVLEGWAQDRIAGNAFARVDR